MRKNKILLSVLIITYLCALFTGCSTETATQIDGLASSTQAVVKSNADLFNGYTLINVDGGDLSGSREANVVVDIGYGNREYYAYTNEYGQLVMVTADEIILQDDATEPVTEDGRYYPDEARVPGTEAADLDEGHVIADSLGGVSNAYNVTPQESTLNRHGDQAYMEKAIRDAGGCTNFTAIITYPDPKTQTPSHYSYTYTINGNITTNEFDNVHPDEVNAKINSATASSANQLTTDSSIAITMLDKTAEYVEITNNGSEPINMTGWYIVSVKGDQTYNFPNGFTISPGNSMEIVSGNATGDLQWTTDNVWNNSQSDPAELHDNNGNLVSKWDD